MDCSLPGSSVHGIFQARVLEWGAIAFSNSILLLQSKWTGLMILRNNYFRCVSGIVVMLKLILKSSDII